MNDKPFGFIFLRHEYMTLFLGKVIYFLLSVDEGAELVGVEDALSERL